MDFYCSEYNSMYINVRQIHVMHICTQCTSEYIFNPRRMREGYGSRSVCVCECVCLLPS